MLFVNVNLITMTGKTAVPDQAVLTEGTRIVTIGPSDELGIQERQAVVDGGGAYLMPGLADMHMHTRPEWLGGVWPVCPFHLYLAHGVTTIRDLGPTGDDPAYVLRWRDEVEGGARAGPSILSSGPPLFGPAADPAGEVWRQQAQGYDCIKLYSFLSRSEFHEAMTAARQAGMYATGHVPFAVGLDGVLDEGMDEIAHVEELGFEFMDFDREQRLEEDEWFANIMEAAVQQYELQSGIDHHKIAARLSAILPAVLGKLRSAGAAVCTTMVVGQTIAQKLLDPEPFLARPENRYLPQEYLETFRRGEERHQIQFRGHEGLALFKAGMEKTILAALHQAGVMLLLSTDAGTGEMGLVPGDSVHKELQILTENGLTPYEAIATGTLNAARVVKKMTGEGEFGTIEVGKRADLMLVQENPLDDVAHMREPLGVMASGRWYSRAALEQMTTVGSSG